MRNWICPDCGETNRAPDRPRRDDVRRYCLPCSKRTGRLTEKTCPALDRARTERQTRSAALRKTKTERARARAREARSWNGVDLEDQSARLWRLRVRSQVVDPGRVGVSGRGALVMAGYVAGPHAAPIVGDPPNVDAREVLALVRDLAAYVTDAGADWLSLVNGRPGWAAGSDFQ